MKTAEQKAFKEYPLPKEETESTSFINQETFNSAKRIGYIVGYDQAVKDIQEQAEKSVIEKSNGEVTIEDLVAYNQGFKIGRELTMQDFLEKAEEFFYEQFNIHPHDCHVIQYVSDTPLEDIDDFVEQFKNYMQDESEN